MREIIFRGKRLNDGEWIEGSLCTTIPSDENFYTISYFDFGGYYIEEKVIPETIGQYTGLTDKNGKKIFEGDIVKTQPFYDRPYSDKRKSKEFIGVVKYKIKIFNGNKYYSKQCYHGEWGLEFNEDFGKYTEYFWGELWNCEVIGNIYDNREVLEETPTADVAEVVRCKDCKHYKKINYDDISQNTCEITTKRQQPYDYCSYGERIDMNDL